MNIAETEFVVFDVETTGLSPKSGDRIVEIGAVKVKGKTIIGTFESFVNPKRDLPLEAQRINNITPEMVADAPLSEQILPEFLHFVGGACLAGHNVKFDLEFICCELALLNRKLKEETPAFDTLVMARKLMPHLTNHKLSTVARSFGVTIQETHRALADVHLTVAVLYHLINLAQKQQIEKFQQLVKEYSVVKPIYKLQSSEQSSFF